MKSLLFWLKKSLKNTREIFWPLLDEDDETIETIEEELELKVTKVNLKKALELKFRISDNEDNRRNSIESKASLFISTISVTTSLVIAANALTIGNNEYQNAIKISVLISFILTIYTLRTVWFSVKALARKGYHMLDVNDINIGGNEEEFNKALLIRLAKYTKSNEAVINEKVDNFVLAQEYYKRSIIIICIYAFSVLMFCMFLKKDNTPQHVLKPKYVLSENAILIEPHKQLI